MPSTTLVFSVKSLPTVDDADAEMAVATLTTDAEMAVATLMMDTATRTTDAEMAVATLTTDTTTLYTATALKKKDASDKKKPVRPAQKKPVRPGMKKLDRLLSARVVGAKFGEVKLVKRKHVKRERCDTTYNLTKS
jgi:hypothetical protein